MRVVTLAILALIYLSFPISAQKTYDNNASIEQQFEFVEEEGSRWQNYVMIIDRSFNQLKGNVLKTIKDKDATISRLETTIVSKDSLISSLEKHLQILTRSCKRPWLRKTHSPLWVWRCLKTYS